MKPGDTAFIFESNKEYDKALFTSRLKENLKGYSFLRKTLSGYFLKKQLRMTYSLSEFELILKQTKFRNSYKIHPVELGNLPIYVRLELKKE